MMIPIMATAFRLLWVSIEYACLRWAKQIGTDKNFGTPPTSCGMIRDSLWTRPWHSAIGAIGLAFDGS